MMLVQHPDTKSSRIPKTLVEQHAPPAQKLQQRRSPKIFQRGSAAGRQRPSLLGHTWLWSTFYFEHYKEMPTTNKTDKKSRDLKKWQPTSEGQSQTAVKLSAHCCKDVWAEFLFCQLLRKRHHINKISKRDPVFAGVNIVQVPPMVHWPVSNLFVTTKFVSYFEMTCEQKLSLPCSLHPEEKRHLCLDLYKRLHHKVVALLWVPSQLCWEWSLVRLFIQYSLYPTTSNTQTSSCLYSLTEDVMRYIATRVPHPKTSPYKNVKSVQKAKVCEQSNLQYHVITMRNWQTWNTKGNGGKKRVVIICPQAMLPSSISSIAMATRFLEIFIFVEFLDNLSA